METTPLLTADDLIEVGSPALESLGGSLSDEVPSPLDTLETIDGQRVHEAQQMAAFRHLACSVFGHATLRPHQETALQEVAKGHDCLAVLPTGSGKSLCYALPALARDGIVLVVSPLIALIRDQVRKFSSYGLPCASFDSHQSGDEKREVWDQIAAGRIKMLLVSPERLARAAFRARLLDVKIQLVAIDEAHCISQWGFHFRPEYRRVGEYLKDFGDIPKIALTATATAKVRSDIKAALRLRTPTTIVGDVARENLELRVLTVSSINDQVQSIADAAREIKGAGIVYASTRKLVFEIHAALRALGEPAAMYHAGLSPEVRKDAQARFVNGTARIVVATNAFGLGIDKYDIRFVFHASLPSSVEQYVQEIGRAGRDGKPSQCLLVAGSRDYYVQRFMIDKSFPDVGLLKTAYQCARDYLGTSAGQSEAALFRHLRQITKLNDEDIKSAQELLYREGILQRLVTPGSGFDDGADALVTLGHAGEDERRFWSEYPLRKIDQLGKLDKMRAYVGTTDRSGFLNHYFRQ